MPQSSLPIYQITEQNLLFIVLDEDPVIHTDAHPFCLDPECPCKEDETLNRMFIIKPLDAGLLTGSEAIRLYFGTQLTPTQDGGAISDEETMKIIEIRSSEVEIEDEHRYRSTVFLQGDGKWKCLRCDRYRCEHAKFVQRANPTLPELPSLSEAELADLIDHD